MSTTSTSWDFSQVHALLDSLSQKEQSYLAGDHIANGQEQDTQLSPPAVLANPSYAGRYENTKTRTSSGLGDFSQIWRFLGTPTETPGTPRTPGTPVAIELPTSPTLQQRVPVRIEYASDGAAYIAPGSAKKLQWRDEVSDSPLVDVASESDTVSASKLSKKQRKKANRRKRMQEELARRAASDMDSEADMPTPVRNPAARASIHSLRSAYDSSRSRAQSDALHETTKVTTMDDSSDEPDPLSQQLAENGRRVLARYNSEPPEPVAKVGEKPHTKEWPVSNPQAAQALAFLPASVRPPRSPRTVTTTSPTPTPSRQTITPKIIRSGPDRHWAILLKLLANFYEDKATLVAPANLTTHSSDPAGIHVFVDASNIFIGFHDQLKRARDIPVNVRVPRVDMSFDALSLLMERRRPVAKRVLAGSTPAVPAFEVARKVGYECSILDKVYKARELTARQRFFAARDKSDTDGYSSAGEPTHAPQKFVEQGVDEIIHLKMLESVVDAEPATMVLATGDAAQAEYSAGFMKMVERALRKGWSVELVSWSANISSAYTKPSFRKLWGDKFKIIELDDYAEELLDM